MNAGILTFENLLEEIQEELKPGSVAIMPKFEIPPKTSGINWNKNPNANELALAILVWRLG